MSPASAGFQKFRVTAKVRESRTITSFHLTLVDHAWLPFTPGQFLVFKLPMPPPVVPGFIPGTQGWNPSGLPQPDHLPDAVAPAGFILREYSISSSPSQTGHYRITVKREPASSADVPAGAGSNYLHDHINVGDEVLADGPRGAFRLDRTSDRPVVLLSGGVGLTPVVSMLPALVEEPTRPVFFIHACDSGDVHALGAELKDLALLRPGVKVHTCYRSPRAGDAGHDSEGVIDRALLQKLLPLDDYDVYLCGPPGFMQAVYRDLRSLGVPKARIATEFFGPATVLEPTVAAPTPPAPVHPTPVAGEITVEFRKSGRVEAWTGADSLLDFAESHGLSPDFSCRAGVCNTCKTGLISGAVDYFEIPLDDPGKDHVLLCCSKPTQSVVLDL